MSAQPGKNPYRPGAAVPPLFLAGRTAEKRRFSGILRGAPELPANVRLTGLRGVGKTVLLKESQTRLKLRDGSSKESNSNRATTLSAIWKLC